MRRTLLKQLKTLLAKPEYLALLFALIFGSISAYAVPQMTINDEDSHFLKAYGLSEGKITGNTCEFPKSVFSEASSSPEHTPRSSSLPIDYQDTASKGCGRAAGYSPIMHLPQAIGIFVAKMLNGSPDLLVLFGRLFNVIFYATALFFIIRFVRVGKWAYFVIGLFPLMIHTAGSLSADTMNNVIVMAALAFVINLFTQSQKFTKNQLIILLALSAMLALTKQTNLILLLPLAALPVRLFKKNDFRFKIRFNVHKWLVIGGVLLTGILTVLLAYKLFGSMLFREDHITNPLVHDPLRFFYISYNTYINPVLGYGDLLVRGIVGEFSSFRYHLPTFIIFIQLVALLVALFYNSTTERRVTLYNAKLYALLSTISLLLLVAAITVALYSAWTILPERLGINATYADGVQGRYFTAALAALVPVAFYMRKWVKIEASSDLIPYCLIIFISLSSLLFYTAQTINFFWT